MLCCAVLSCSIFIHCAAAVPAYHLQRPVKAILDRDEDMQMTGGLLLLLGCGFFGQHSMYVNFRLDCGTFGYHTAMNLHLFSVAPLTQQHVKVSHALCVSMCGLGRTLCRKWTAKVAQPPGSLLVAFVLLCTLVSSSNCMCCAR